MALNYCISAIKRRGYYLFHHAIYCGYYSRVATNQKQRFLNSARTRGCSRDTSLAVAAKQGQRLFRSAPLTTNNSVIATSDHQILSPTLLRERVNKHVVLYRIGTPLFYTGLAHLWRCGYYSRVATNQGRV